MHIDRSAGAFRRDVVVGSLALRRAVDEIACSASGVTAGADNRTYNRQSR
jgi:hypothetical protein